MTNDNGSLQWIWGYGERPTLFASFSLSLFLCVNLICVFCAGGTQLRFRCGGFVTRHLKNHRKYLAVIFMWCNSNSISGTFIRTKRNEFINVIWWCGVGWLLYIYYMVIASFILSVFISMAKEIQIIIEITVRLLLILLLLMLFRLVLV